MQRIMAQLRASVESVGGLPVTEVTDYSAGISGLPKSNVLRFKLDPDASLVVRPSGTEPKLKAYVSVSAKGGSLADSKALAGEIEAGIAADVEKLLAIRATEG